MAFFAGGGGHDVWKPRKTMRDWGRTEYRIIRNWTPREQRGSGPAHPPGSSAHSANGSQVVGGEMEDPGLSDHGQEEEDVGEVRREGGGRLDSGLGTSRSRQEELQQSREQASDRTRQKSPLGSRTEANILTDMSPANSRLMSQDSSPANSRLTSQDSPPTNSRLTSQDRPPANSRLTSQDSPPANSRLTSQDSPPTNSRLTSQDRPPANSRLTSQDSPPANSRLTSQDSPPTNSRLTSQDRPPANSRLTSQDRPPANSRLTSQDSPPANSRLTSQDSPPANSRLTSQDSPPANSRLTSLSNRTTRSIGGNRTTQSPTVTLHQSQVSHDAAADRMEDDSSGSQAEDFGDPGQSEHHMELLSTSSPDGRSRTTGASSRSLGRKSAKRSGRGYSDRRPRRELGTSPVDRSQTGSTQLDDTWTDLPETSTGQRATKGGRGRGRGRGRSKGRRQQGAPAEKVSVRLWQPRHTSRTARDLGELDICLSLYHDQLREALESTESVTGERALTAHWKATQKQVLAMIRDLHIVKALEKRLNKERSKSRRLQQDLLTLMGTQRRTNGDYQHALDEAKQAQKADELSAKKAEIRSLTRALRPLTEKFSL